MRIPFYSHIREYEAHRDLYEGAIKRALDSTHVVLGESVAKLECWFGDHFDGFGIGVGSGTDALALAVRAVCAEGGAMREANGVGEVITAANTCTPTVAAIRMAGLMPRLVDVDPVTLMLDATKIEAAITERTRCILPVHLFGGAAPMRRVIDIARRNDLKVVEDCAQSFGTTIEGKPAGSFGDVACFSFYPTKNLGAVGDGGMCVARDAEVARRIRALRTYGYDDSGIACMEGVNSRLDTLQASVLLAKLGYVVEDLLRRRQIAKRYDEALAGSSSRPIPAGRGVEHSYHIYAVECADRDPTREDLENRGIHTLIHYPYPVHLMPAYAFLGYRKGDFPVTEAACTRIFSLPVFPYLTEAEVAYVCAQLGLREGAC